MQIWLREILGEELKPAKDREHAIQFLTCQGHPAIGDIDVITRQTKKRAMSIGRQAPNRGRNDIPELNHTR
jgi:hypothetical protein